MDKIAMLLLYLSSHSLPSLAALLPPDSNYITDIWRNLPIGHKVDGFLSVDMPIRYYFNVNRSLSAVTIRVTPCESPILWTLSFLTAHGSLEQWGSHQKYRHRTSQTLFSFEGNGEETVSTAVTSGGFFYLDIISLESDTSFQVFVWNNQDDIPPWPQLPSDPRVDVLSAQDDTVKLSWKPSLGPAEANFEYCVFINKKHNFKTLCATQLNTMKDVEGHQDTEDDMTLNVITESLKNKINAYPKPSKSLKIPGVVEHETNEFWSSQSLSGSQRVCVGPRTNATIHGLKPKSLYYFDVFALSRKRGTSVAYTGTFAETKPKHKSQVPKLPNDEMVDIFLKSKGIKVIAVDPPSYGFKWLFVHSCLHKVHIQIMLNGQVQLSQSLQGAQNFKLGGNSKGNFIISLKSSKGGLGLVKLFTTNIHNNLPFPSLPSAINFSASKRSCSSATLTWTSNGYENKYCIYARRIEQNLDLRLIQKHQNGCLSTSYRAPAERVLCRKVGSKTLIEEHITDLKPGKSYLFDLYFIGHNNTTIKFPSRAVKTQESCT
ncbi:PREDICTED: protein NDNF-like [Nanorana parkeri]|uniref:protein NDNF-like n=1 Tax=Nanorana parkeri TaxID=125878 RepID=UPI0008542825|nr:PREDICTED: protein NDNF-like [Nanorana parkeri]